MNNTQYKSVSASSTKSKAPKNKASKERQSRKESYRKKFNRPHMIIPQEDFEWLQGKNNQVKELFLDCWLSDPYGSRWMPLSHSLKTTSFRIGRKALSEAGLFIFRRVSSIRDAREIVCWEVLNLHGSRKTEYWLAQEKEVKNATANYENHENPKNTENHETACTNHKNQVNTKNECANPKNIKNPSQNHVNTKNIKNHENARANHENARANHENARANHENARGKNGNARGISSESYTESQIQNPSVASQERLSNSSKELLETLQTDLWSDESDRDLALEGQVTSASPNEEKTEAEGTNPTEVQADLVNQSNSDSKQVAQSVDREAPGVLTNESTQEILNQSYSVDRFSTDSVELCKAQNLASDEWKEDETYQTSMNNFFTRIQAKLALDSKKDKIKRFGYESNPMSFSDRQALEEYKRELEEF